MEYLNRDEIWFLKQFNLFDNFTTEELERVTHYLRFNEFKRREPIVLPAEETRRIYFLLRGKAKLSRIDQNGKELILDILKPGEIFGPIAYPQKHYSDVQVIALNDCLVGQILEHDFHLLMQNKPELCLAVNKIIGSKLVKIESRLEELLFKGIPCRLARLLLRLSEEYPYNNPCGIRIDIRLTQQEIANLIGASREAVSMVLNDFKEQQWIAVHKHFICIHNLKALENLAI